MAITAEDRGVLERRIDNAIEIIPLCTQITRQLDFKNELRVTTERDFVFGMIWGHVMISFLKDLSKRYKRVPTNEEITEIVNIIRKRSRDIEDAIFRTG